MHLIASLERCLTTLVQLGLSAIASVGSLVAKNSADGTKVSHLDCRNYVVVFVNSVRNK